MLHRRADATIAYPRNINYYATVEKSLNAEWFQSYPIAEHNEMIDVFFACSRHSQHSKELIAKINLLITENRKTFATEYAKWLSNDQKKLYGKRLKDTWPSP